MEAEPIEFDTRIFPEAPLPTTAVITESETTLNKVAFVPPKFTEVAPHRFLPFIVTIVPESALAGEKELTTGR